MCIRDSVGVLLSAYALWQLGARLTEAEGSLWRLLADGLGLEVEQIAAALSEHPDNPGFGTIMVWSRRKNSTIGVLRKALVEVLKRRDLVEMLDKARQSTPILR